ncbi:hypothetical protein K493DRAFT_314437 [Basidiobolus meristosporus CBS 931.73]|uniref:Mitochondrial intermembrane space import and assembly protein 40 n=1 Tax=Basidiobolus meristosporus CBS 931.73 TaxID=1314790 RepID=A0A1Y1YEZ5_9FUNG|nr:hypothetical protein K493DRAFT_314437 [Basidiobolus meristosporus CBS 931.73]|eukprot:ORX96567.1 hypothetical protein K493DRAFT_314437 [Basidiobolus meristosporus CBS 931.73]
MSNSPKEEKEIASVSETEPTSESPETTATEEEQDQTAAFDPVTGEINWDCPCLGGMAKGPCGEEFKEAFSCFVKSGAEPKGIDCVEKFSAMQNCFREHPEEYSDVLDDDDDDEEEEEETKAEEKEAKAE